MTIDLSRRSFLIGLGATAVVAAVPKIVPALEPIASDLVELPIAAGRDWAALEGVQISGLDHSYVDIRAAPPMFVKFFRKDNEQPLMHWGMHPYSNLHWLAAPGYEIVIRRDWPVRMDLEPCSSHTAAIALRYNIERDPRERRKVIGEIFHCRNGQVIMREAHAEDVRDEHLIG